MQLHEPVNKLTELTRYVVQRLKILCPSMGKVKIAEMLARAGVHLGASSAGRILKEKPAPGRPPTDTEGTPEQSAKAEHVVTAKYPNHVWHVDLTLVPTVGGLWTSWLPFALPQCWPFAYWLGVVLDHFSRRVMGFTVFKRQPTSEQVRALLGRAIAKAKKTPRHLICDKGPQFWCDGFKTWCRRKRIKPRYGAIGQHGSIAVVERFILTMKCLLSCLTFVPLRRDKFRGELEAVVQWYNAARPHMSLGGKTPDEVYYGLPPANRAPRFELRPRWPRASPCARPQTLIKGQPGVRLELEATYHAGRKHLPIVTLRRAG